ncbi:MAG TPA: hypothetical protein VFU22_29875 [Roseiflexaceae bacterium]|nr:hypothetical protein [Roseiflexaceae bacterium]
MKISEDAASAAPEQVAVERQHRAQIWRLASEATLSDQERLILCECLVYALPPLAIQARHPDMFSDVAEIYRLKLDLLQRFQRNHTLQQLCLESTAL